MKPYFLFAAVSQLLTTLRLGGTTTITTVHLIEELCGSYDVDHRTPPALSYNAFFGKLLSRHRTELGLTLSRRKVRIKQYKTNCAEWTL